MSTIQGTTPIADWMTKYNTPSSGDCDCGCSCDTPCYPICGDEGSVDSNTLYQQMQNAVRELERIINGLDLPATVKYQILHLATCNIKLCMNLLELIKQNASDISSINEQITNINSTITEIQSDIADMKGDISTIQTQISNLETKDNNLQTQINENTTAINELKLHKVSRCEFEKVAHSVYNHHLAICNLETQVTNNKTAVDNSISELTTKINAVELVANTAMGKVNEIAAVVTADKIAALESGIKENAASIESLKEAYNNNREYIGSVDAMVQLHDTAIKNLQVDCASYASKIAINAAGVEENRKNLAGLRAAVESLQAVDDVHGTDIATLKVRVDNLDGTCEALETKINQVDAGLSTEVNAVTARVDEMEPKVEEIYNQGAALIEQVNGLDAKVTELGSTVEGFDARIATIESEGLNMQNDIASLKQTDITINNNLVTSINNINQSLVDAINTINGGIDNEIRPVLTENTSAIAEHSTQIGNLQAADITINGSISGLETRVAALEAGSQEP